MKRGALITHFRRHQSIWMGLGLTALLAFGYSLGAWYARLPDKLSMQKYIPQITFTGERTTDLRPVAAGATGCASIQSSLKGEFIGPKVWAYTCQSADRESSPADGQIVLNLSTQDPNMQLVAQGSACNAHWYMGGRDLRYSTACFSNLTRFSGGGTSLSAANGMWNVMGISGAAVACTIQVKINGSPSKCECVYASYGSVSAPPCTPSNNPNSGAAPPPAAPTSPPAPKAPLTIPEILKQGTACGEHTESDYTCSKDHLSHTVRHVKYCENGSQKFVSLGCNGAGETRQWEDMTAEVQANQGKFASTLGGCESLNLSCPAVPNNTAPTQPPATMTPAPTATPTPVIIPPTAVPTATPTPVPTVPTTPPLAPISSQGVLQVAPLGGDSTYYLSFTTVPGDVAFGLYFANGTDISLENQINAALTQQGISVPTLKNQTANAYLYDLPFLINDPSTRLSFTLYKRPKRTNSLPVTLSTFIEQSKGCLSTVMPNTYMIDVTSIQTNSPCR